MKKYKQKKPDNSIFDPPEDPRLKAKKEEQEDETPKIPLKLGKSDWGGVRIDVPHFEKVKNHFPLPDGHILAIIIGASGEGKSFQLLSLVPCFGKLSQVMVHSLIVGNPVYMALETYCKEKGIKYGFSSDPDSSKTMIEEYIADKPEGTWSLSIFDDYNSGSRSFTDQFNKVQNMAYMMLRNYSNHSICLTQEFHNVPILARNNVNMLIAFRMKGRSSVWGTSKAFNNLTGHSEDQFMRLYDQIRTVKHAYIMIVENKTYVSIPNKTSGLEEVEFESDTSEEIPDDDKLDSLISTTEDNPTKTNKKNLVRYIKILANQQGIPLEKMVNMVNVKYAVSIEV